MTRSLGDRDPVRVLGASLSSIEGSETDKIAAFELAARDLEARIGPLIELVRTQRSQS